MNLSFTSTDLEDVLIGILGQRLKYDRKHDKIIVLGELMNKKNIIDILQNKECHYTTFLENAKKLIDEKSLDKELFEVEFNE
jgi:competence protein ComGA